MQITNFNVGANSISPLDPLPVVVAGSVGTHGVHFTFTDEIWKDLTVTATFRASMPYKGELAAIPLAITDKDATYVVPPEVLAMTHANIQLELLGLSATNTTVVPTLRTKYTTTIGSNETTNILDESNRTPSIYEQWLEKINVASEAATATATTSASEATTQATRAEESANTAAARAEDARAHVATVLAYSTAASASATSAANSASAAQNTATESTAAVSAIAAQAAQSAENAAANAESVTGTIASAVASATAAASTSATSANAAATEAISAKNATQAIADTVGAIVAGNEAYTKAETYSRPELHNQFASGIWVKKTGQTVECCPADGSMLEITLYGKTTQEGEGTPSAENIRPIHGVTTGFSITSPDGETTEYPLPDGIELFGDEESGVYDTFEPCVWVDGAWRSRLVQRWKRIQLTDISSFHSPCQKLFQASTGLWDTIFDGAVLCNRLPKRNDNQTSFMTGISIQSRSINVCVEGIETLTELEPWIAENPLDVIFALYDYAITILSDPILLLPCSAQANKYAPETTQVFCAQGSLSVGYNQNQTYQYITEHP